MWVLNQDRDAIYRMIDEDLMSVPVMCEHVLIGFNLFMEDHFLGTFNSLNEVQKEMIEIMNCEYEFYTISGFSHYDGTKDFFELIERMNINDEIY